jgi:hypothetical protein
VADDKQGTLGGLPGEFRCCDHETSIVLIILLQHDAERSSRDIGKIGTTAVSNCSSFARSVVLSLDTGRREDPCPGFLRCGKIQISVEKVRQSLLWHVIPPFV